MVCVNVCFVLFTLGITILDVSTLNVKREVNEKVTCTLPDHPENGRWKLLNGNGRTGDTIDFGTVIQFSCNPGYTLRTKSSFVVCTKEFNPNQMPQCAKKCPPMYSTSTTVLKCVNENYEEIECSEATDGSYMTYSCIPYYEPPIGFRRNILCLDGVWNYPKPVCQPVCGKKITNDKSPLIYGGTEAQKIEYPWIAAIFRRDNGEFVNICGGSLISRRVILTAAHCLTDEQGGSMPKGDFRVGVGKLYSDYKDPRDDQAQYLEALRIVTRRGYRGPIRNYIEDIGLIVTKKLVTLSPVVQPVCISDISSMHLHVGTSGEIAGWGAKEDGESSEILRKLEIPYKDQTQCAQELNMEDYFADKYNLIDKMCAGFYNKRISVCKGDSGSGLYFRNLDENRYYVHGIVSIGPSNRGKCSINQNALYTRVSFYYEFIDRETTKHYREDCRLPPYPNNGFWTIESVKQRYPGDIVSSTTTMKVFCRDGYELVGESLISCDSAVRMPKCEEKCEPLSFHLETKVSCMNKNRTTIDCNSATDGSTLEFSCLTESGSYGPEQFRRCERGSWGSPSPTCPRLLTTTTARTTTKTTVLPPIVRTGSSDSGKGLKLLCTYDSSYYPKEVLPEDLDPYLCSHLACKFSADFDGNDANDLFSRLPRFYNTGNSKGLFDRMTDMKKLNRNLKVVLHITGYKSEKPDPYSVVSANDTNVDGFIDGVITVLRNHNFDGFILDWHNPDVAEKDNFARLITRAKKKLKDDNNYLFVVAVGSVLSNTGYDAKLIGEKADLVYLKCYDFYGDWSSVTGQTSALYASSKDNAWQRSQHSVNASVTNWLRGGVPKEKLLVALSFQTRFLALTNSSLHEVHSPMKGYGPARSGALQLGEICQGYQDYTEVWDDEQKNPYKYNDKYWFGYENEKSLSLKIQYVKEKMLAGFIIHPINGDDIYGKCKEKHHYLKHVRNSIGVK